MEKFKKTLRGYDPDEVNKFLDQVILKVEEMVNDIKTKDKKIQELEGFETENKALKEKLAYYERTEATLNKAILMAQKTSDQMRMATTNECEAMVNDAKRNANRIVNEALLRAEATENEALKLKRNINVFKRRVRDIISAQLDVVSEMDHVDL